MKKRKDFTPKKKNQESLKKAFVVLSDSSDSSEGDLDEVLGQAVRKKCEHDQQQHIRKLDFCVVVDDDDGDSPAPIFYRGNKNLPLYSRESPSISEIFSVCMFGTDATRIAKQKPLRIRENGTFVVHQKNIQLKHPYDLDADDTPGAFTKKDSVRFYEVKINKEDRTLALSSEVHVTRDDEGRVLSGSYNKRVQTTWKARPADLSQVYAVFRRRAVHKKTQKEEGASFTRVVMFIMPLNEFNQVNGKLKDMLLLMFLFYWY